MLQSLVKLGNLNLIDLEFGDGADWLEGFGGVMLENLEWDHLGYKLG